MRISIVNGATAALAVLAFATIAGAQSSTPHRDARTTRAERIPAQASSVKSAKSPSALGDTDSLAAKADRGRIDGNPAAKVWVIEISDMECPFCKRWHDEVFPKLREEFIKPGKIRFAYINFPLSQHRHAFAAATAAMCAGAQGKFWQMHDNLFATQKEWEKLDNSDDFFKGQAQKAGVDMAKWQSCLTSPSIKSLIEADRDRARSAGVESTPSFLIAKKLYDGARPWDEMRKTINDAIAAAQ